jgi:hypothetical protein
LPFGAFYVYLFGKICCYLIHGVFPFWYVITTNLATLGFRQIDGENFVKDSYRIADYGVSLHFCFFATFLNFNLKIVLYVLCTTLKMGHCQKLVDVIIV